jgi:hypothetical protein
MESENRCFFYVRIKMHETHIITVWSLYYNQPLEFSTRISKLSQEND